MQHPSKTGQIVTLVEGDDQEIWVVTEIDIRSGKATIIQLRTGLDTPPFAMLPITELKIAMVGTSDLIGSRLGVQKDNGELIYGRVRKVDQDFIELDLFKGKEGALSNVYATIVDREGVEHYGRLYIDKPE